MSSPLILSGDSTTFGQLDFGVTGPSLPTDYLGNIGTKQSLDLPLRFRNDNTRSGKLSLVIDEGLMSEGYLVMAEDSEQINREWEEIGVIPPEY